MRTSSSLLLSISLLIAAFGVSAQEFEGSIYFTKSNMLDVTRYAYHVKGNMVRVDELVEGSDNLEATLLVNLETGQMIALSHERNLYMVRPKRADDVSVKDVEVREGALKRSIYGMNCTQYRVKKSDADREIMYWVAEGNYSFLPKLLTILKRKDNFSTYYMNLPDLDHKLPLLAEENTLLREKKGFLQVDRIEKKHLDNSMFEIPEGFEKVER